MNKENMEKWLADLETTDEPQSCGLLTRPTGDCCLGRLCKVALADGVPIDVEEIPRGPYEEPHTQYDHSHATPPESVLNWAGIPPASGLIDECITWNDTLSLSFSEIAKNIREFCLTDD